MKPITRRLQRLRLDRNRISQREVATKADMPVLRYWEIENGYRDPSPEDLRALSKVLRCSQSDILGQSESVAS